MQNFILRFCVQSGAENWKFSFLLPPSPQSEKWIDAPGKTSILDRAFTVGRLCTLKITLFGLLKFYLGRLCSIIGVGTGGGAEIPFRPPCIHG